MSEKLLTAAMNAAATIDAIYQWLDRVEAAGGATSLEGVAACHAMLKSLAQNRARVQTLVVKPLREAIKERGDS